MATRMSERMRHLRVHAHAAEHDGAGQLQVFAVGTHRFFNLGREFAGGGEDQGANAGAPPHLFWALRLMARRCSSGR